jgi:hypothetical protein
MRRASGDDRAVSETAGVVALVLLTALVAASVGISVLFVNEEDAGGIDAEFEFRHFSDQSILFITYNAGPELSARNVTVVAPDRNVTWAELGSQNASDAITPGSGVQLSQNNAYGAGVPSSASVSIVYTQAGNRTVIGSYSGED